MNKERFMGRLSFALIGCVFACTACVNEVDDNEFRHSDVPIRFAIDSKAPITKSGKEVFKTGDKVGLFAMQPDNAIDGKRYIDNLELTVGANSNLSPAKDIFYPEGKDASLNFISYYPYLEKGVEPGTASLPVCVQTNQDQNEQFMQSDLLTATATGSVNNNETVILQYKHCLTKVKLTLVPGKNETLEAMAQSNPRVIATGFLTKGTYNLKNGTFQLTEGSEADIVSNGNWTKNENDNTLTGKEFIILPQKFTEKQTILMEWNGRVYSCPMPTINEVKENAQYEIKITSLQAEDKLLTGIAGSISEWGNEAKEENTENNGNYNAIHLAVLSFDQSNVYRIYAGSTPISEIVLEYLCSSKLTSKAIVAYPILENGKTDLTAGTVLQLFNNQEPIKGGKLVWKDNSFEYTPGNLANVSEIYFDNNNKLCIQKPSTTQNVSIVKYVIRDTKAGIKEYPIVKIGTQYWMRENLCTETYSDGSPIEQSTELSNKPSYFKADDGNHYYNGEAVIFKTLAPADWHVPTIDEWNQLLNYLNGDVSLLKTGTWENSGTLHEETPSVAPIDGSSMFRLMANGIWNQGKQFNAKKIAGFWGMSTNSHKLPDKVPFFIGESNEIIMSSSVSLNAEHFKALSIRCIKD